MNTEFLKFFIEMKDLMSSPLIKLAKNAKTTFTSIQSDIKKAIQQNREYGDSFDYVERKARSSSLALGGWVRRIGLAAGAAAILSFGKSSINSAMNYGATKKSFEVLTGSPQAGGNLANSLNKLQQDTILGPEVFNNAKTMLGFGIATEKVLPTMKMLGDVAMGDADKLQALTLAYSQTQAAGRLMGQDLLQYINAGFNPLQEISKKTGVSIGELRKQMEKGSITADMVTEAFKSATGAGGKFNNMMEQISQTPFGRAQILKGQWESLKITIGDSLLPIANTFMKWGSGLADVLHLQNQLSDTLLNDKMRIDALVGSITSLNMGNETRKKMLGDLVHDYPELFGQIDIEKVKNSELLSILNDVNAAYDKRINFAANDEMISNETKDMNNTYARFKKYITAAEYVKNGNKVKAMQEVYGSLAGSLMIPKSESYFRGRASELLNEYNKHKSNIAALQVNKGVLDDERLYQDALSIVNDTNKLKAKFPDQKKQNEFMMLVYGMRRAYDQYMASGPEHVIDSFTTNKGGLSDLRKMMSASDIKGSGGGGGIASGITGGNSGGSVASGITGGGPRVININGVTFKAAEKIEVSSVVDAKQIADQIEPIFEEMYLRVLNSGASVQ